MTALHPIDEPHPSPRNGFALWELGFRPFYLLASLFASLSIALWALQFSGLLGVTYLGGPVWHAHEMLFGFALAVIVGFLYTAGRNWTGRATPTGAALAMLAAWWLLGRVLVLTPWGWPAALVNISFPLAAAVGLAIPLVRARNRRNYFFIGLLLALAVACAVVHLHQLGIVRAPAAVGMQLGLDVVLFIVSVMAGRVVPMFTQNGVPGAAPRRHPAVERASLGLVLALAAADALGVPAAGVASVAAAGALAHAARWALWQPWATRKVPLVWVLHLAYLWVPIHLALRAAAEWGAIAPSLATHALTVGAIGGLILGMMSRTARGHTARPLRADRFDTISFALVLLAAVVRVLPPLLMPASTLIAVLGSAALWSAAFGLYAWRYAPVLTRPRLDGRPG
jgi:uncharacterized protein involved in response to NO